MRRVVDVGSLESLMPEKMLKLSGRDSVTQELRLAPVEVIVRQPSRGAKLGRDAPATG